MKKQNSFDYRNRKYSIVPYTNRWKKSFARESQIIKKIFGKNTRIEHIGSTSVLGMNGKPCIDILVIPKNLEIVRKHISDMEKRGYMCRGAFVQSNSLLFVKIKDNIVETNVHFFSEGHKDIPQMLMIRDYLRIHPKEVVQYSAFKNELYSKYSKDYASYRKKKDRYMEKLIKRAKREFSSMP